MKNIIARIRRYLLEKKIFYKKINNIISLGSFYGGWSFYYNKNLYNSVLISCGLGEDASFDVEFINKFDATCISIDPTPRAIEHYQKIINKIQQINNIRYDLRNINHENFILIDKAIYNISGKNINFYVPQNPKHISHSINNWQNDYRTKDKHISVKTITLKEVLKQKRIKKIEILKLDIEGAEIEVINNIIADKIFPNQILIEYDELHKICRKSIKRFWQCHTLLLKNNYVTIKTKKPFPNMLYIKNKI